MAKRLPGKLVHTFCDLAHHDKNLPKLKAMLEETPALLNAARPGRDKETAMGAALHSNAKKTIKFLLNEGVEKDVFVSCVLREYDAIEAYLDEYPKHIKARAKYAHKMDLMDLAPTKKMTNLLLKRGFPLDIHVAVGKGMFDKVDQFLKDDPNLLENCDDEGASPLFSAIWSAQDEMALYLLEKGADHDLKGAGGRPLSYAILWGRTKIVEALLERGVDMKYVGLFRHFSYLHTCVEWGADGMPPLTKDEYEVEIVKIINMVCDAGVDPDVRDQEELTAVQRAEKNGFPNRVALIRERFPDHFQS